MNLRNVRKKARSVGNVKKITQAMELVSAVKMRKAQEAAIQAKPYQEFLTRSVHKFTYKLQAKISPLLYPMPNSAKRKLIVVVTTNKGLCGGFNFNLIRSIIQNEEIKKCDFITIGKKGAMLINQIGGKIIADYVSNFPLNEVSAIFGFVLEKYFNAEYEAVSIYYNKFISTLKSEPTEEKFLPFKFEEQQIEIANNYSIEPQAEEIVDSLLRSFLEQKIRFAIAENEAGEHSARMIAMKNATDNATEVISNLTSLGNKLRQQKITYELLDMITAKESVGTI